VTTLLTPRRTITVTVVGAPRGVTLTKGSLSGLLFFFLIGLFYAILQFNFSYKKEKSLSIFYHQGANMLELKGFASYVAGSTPVTHPTLI